MRFFFVFFCCFFVLLPILAIGRPPCTGDSVFVRYRRYTMDALFWFCQVLDLRRLQCTWNAREMRLPLANVESAAQRAKPDRFAAALPCGLARCRAKGGPTCGRALRSARRGTAQGAAWPKVEAKVERGCMPGRDAQRRQGRAEDGGAAGGKRGRGEAGAR